VEKVPENSENPWALGIRDYFSNTLLYGLESSMGNDRKATEDAIWRSESENSRKALGWSRNMELPLKGLKSARFLGVIYQRQKQTLRYDEIDFRGRLRVGARRSTFRSLFICFMETYIRGFLANFLHKEPTWHEGLKSKTLRSFILFWLLC